MRRFTLLFMVFAAAIVATAALAAQQGAGQSPGTVKDVMVTMTIPASDAIFDAASDPPKDDMRWAGVSMNAATLAESGRVLLRPALAKDTAMWVEMARALVTEADGAAAAAKKRDIAALETASDAIYTTCETCHMHYMTPGN